MEYYRNQLKDLHCHFNWRIQEIAGNYDEILTKLSDKNKEIYGQPWINVVLLLTSAYELHKKEYFQEAKVKLEETIKMFDENANDEFLKKYKQAFQHVIFSVKAHIYIDICSERGMKQIFDCIPIYSRFSKEQKAAIGGIEANVFGEYGKKGRKYALSVGRRILMENPNEPEWSLLVGLSLCRIRNYSRDSYITKEEIDCFQRAYELTRSPSYTTYLAQAYSNIALAIKSNWEFKLNDKRITHHERKALIEMYKKKSFELYEEAFIRNKNKCTHIMARCARGFSSLKPWDQNTLNKALDIIKECLKKAPENIFVIDAASAIYILMKQYDSALKLMHKSEDLGNYSASLRIFELKKKLNIPVNFEEVITSLLEKHPVDESSYQTHLYAMSYYLFEEYNLSCVLKHFLSVSGIKIMKREDYTRFVTWIKKRVDLCLVTYNQVRWALFKKTYKNANEKQELENAFEVFYNLYPDVRSHVPKENLLEDIRRGRLNQNE